MLSCALVFLGHSRFVLKTQFMPNTIYPPQINKYLVEGVVTQITPRVKEIAQQIPGKGRQFIEELFQWFTQSGYIRTFSEKERERLLDTEHLQRTADQILQSGYTIACGEHTAAFVALCRAKGIPVKYVEAVGLEWLQKETDENMNSHAFVEAYLDDHWILIDPARRKIYDEINYEKCGYVKWAEGIDFRDLWDEQDRHYSWQNLAVLKRETLAFKRRWEEENK